VSLSFSSEQSSNLSTTCTNANIIPCLPKSFTKFFSTKYISPGLKSDPSKPDWSVCQKAWWAVIKRFYDRYNKDPNDVPMRLALEMRITGGSSVNLAPQYGNTHGTCSIEILTPQNVNRKEWREFTQEITDLWTNLKDDDGEPIHPRTMMDY